MSLGVVQAGQLAANKAQAERTDAKLEEQVDPQKHLHTYGVGLLSEMPWKAVSRA